MILNVAIVADKLPQELMPSALVPIDFSSERLSDSWLEDRYKQNVPFPGLIVSVVMDELAQLARMIFWEPPGDNLGNGDN